MIIIAGRVRLYVSCRQRLPTLIIEKDADLLAYRLLIEKLKLQIARFRRIQFGRSSEPRRTSGAAGADRRRAGRGSATERATGADG